MYTRGKGLYLRNRLSGDSYRVILTNKENKRCYLIFHLIKVIVSNPWVIHGRDTFGDYTILIKVLKDLKNHMFKSLYRPNCH